MVQKNDSKPKVVKVHVFNNYSCCLHVSFWQNLCLGTSQGACNRYDNTSKLKERCKISMIMHGFVCFGRYPILCFKFFHIWLCMDLFVFSQFYGVQSL